jgi:predicted TIM-barrel fold metal-dependent hydrolase
MTKEIDVIEPDAVANIPGPDLNTKTPHPKAPLGSCDCHHHIFGAPNKVPLNPGRQYTPAEATLAQFRTRNKVLGIENSVVVQPSTYGINNDFICAQVEALGENGRGVAVTDMTTSDADLEKLNNAGYRGTRFNVAASGGTPLSELEPVAERIAPMGWNIQFFLQVSKSMVELQDQISKLPVPVVIDHMGAPDLSVGGPEQPGFQALINLLKEGNTYVKLCGAYRLDFTGNPWPAADPFARALIEAAPEQCVWGSDWPHPYCIEPDGKTLAPMPNDGDLFDRLWDWTDHDEDLWKKILVDNPKKLYGFN